MVWVTDRVFFKMFIRQNQYPTRMWILNYDQDVYDTGLESDTSNEIKNVGTPRFVTRVKCLHYFDQ